MLEVDRLVLTLPAGFEARAARLGRLTAEALAALPPPQRGGRLDRLAPAPQVVAANWSDRRIAGQLARAIAAAMAAQEG